MEDGDIINKVFEPTVSYGSIDDQNMLTIIDWVRNGLRFHHFMQVVNKSPFNLSEWSSFLHLSERTMQRYQSEKKSFDPVQSEKIVQINMLHNYGIEVFGDKEKFFAWMNTKNIALGNITPKSLLDNNFGIELVKDELTRIEHGVLA